MRDAAGHEISSYQDVDINMLDKINDQFGYGKNRKINLGKPAALEIDFLHRLRNKLAHMWRCAPSEMAKLFDYYEGHLTDNSRASLSRKD
jgi:hypothetical protein